MKAESPHSGRFVFGVWRVSSIQRETKREVKAEISSFWKVVAGRDCADAEMEPAPSVAYEWGDCLW